MQFVSNANPGFRLETNDLSGIVKCNNTDMIFLYDESAVLAVGAHLLLFECT